MTSAADVRAAPVSVCMVCSGNICRSAMAEIVLRSKVDAIGLGDRVRIDSAGTGDWHVGEPADRRTVAALAEKGYDGSRHRARWFDGAWLADRDLILVADEAHLDELDRLARKEGVDADIRLLRSFDRDAVATGELGLADPYYGDVAGFSRCLREVERACDGLVEQLRRDLG